MSRSWRFARGEKEEQDILTRSTRLTGDLQEEQGINRRIRRRFFKGVGGDLQEEQGIYKRIRRRFSGGVG